MARLVASVMSSTSAQPSDGASRRYAWIRPNPMTPTGTANCMTLEIVSAAWGFDHLAEFERFPSIEPGTHHLHSDGARLLFRSMSVSVLATSAPVTMPS